MRCVVGVSKSEGGPDENPDRRSFSPNMRSVTRVLRLAGVLFLQGVVVAGIRKVIDWLVP